jgi:GTP-binding protein
MKNKRLVDPGEPLGRSLDESHAARKSSCPTAVHITQVATKPPVFALFVGHPEDLTPSYLKYLENQLRETYQFTGTPLRLMVRKK